MPDEEGVEVFEIREADELGAVGLVADIAFFTRIPAAPLGGGLAEEGHVRNRRQIPILDDGDVLLVEELLAGRRRLQMSTR